ncbi:hypothetical protein [Amycolatopsis sulphurea]|uniref:hypothetical protein n=1 Tax=Amycolatopsis sulphurea TaxID=76022 RepID=UPI000BF3D7EE|nr:hypothetical protein [Amycolatopsis sulphurea]
MNRQTGELVNAMTAVTKHIPRATTELLTESLSVVKQHEFAGLLIELGELLHAHADDHDADVPIVTDDQQHGPTDEQQPAGP